MTYLLTFNCYGTRVPGDERGWVDRARGNKRGGYHGPEPGLARYSKELMPDAAYQQDLPRAAHIRTTHVHLIVDRLEIHDRAIAQFKSYASRMLNLSGLETRNCSRWARGGSTRSLRNASAVIAAMKYIVDGQGEPMAVHLMDKSDPRA